MFVKVKFHGLLKKLCPDEYKVDVETAREAIRAVTLQLKDKLVRKDGNLFIFRVPECPSIEDLDKNIQTDEINLYPQLALSGGGGNWITTAIIIVVGVALIAVGGAALLAYAWATAIISSAGAAWAAVCVGAILCLQGISALMMPKLGDTASANNGDPSNVFGLKENTTKIGTPIPIGYGKYMLAGQFLSINSQSIDRGTVSPLGGEGEPNVLIEPNNKWIFTNGKWQVDNG